jgi:hypothetical protein
MLSMDLGAVTAPVEQWIKSYELESANFESLSLFTEVRISKDSLSRGVGRDRLPMRLGETARGTHASSGGAE